MSRALANAYHNLSTMLDAGVPVMRSLNTVIPGMKSRLKKAFLAIADGVSKGETLAETMSMYPGVFKPVDLMIVGVAEKSGNLPGMIGLLSKWHEMSHRMIGRIRSGLALPIVVLLIAAFVYPFPGFILGGMDFGAYLSAVGGILSIYLIPALVIIVIIKFTPGSGPLRRALDSLVLRIPILRKAMYKLALSRYCWAFHMLCKAGVPISDCVEMSTKATGNVIVGDLFLPAAAAVKAGGNMSEGLSRKLPLELVEMWKVGEETGQLDEISERLANSYNEQAESSFYEFARWFPRFVYFLICIMIIRMILILASGVYGNLPTF